MCSELLWKAAHTAALEEAAHVARGSQEGGRTAQEGGRTARGPQEGGRTVWPQEVGLDGVDDEAATAALEEAAHATSHVAAQAATGASNLWASLLRRGPSTGRHSKFSLAESQDAHANLAGDSKFRLAHANLAGTALRECFPLQYEQRRELEGDKHQVLWQEMFTVLSCRHS